MHLKKYPVCVNVTNAVLRFKYIFSSNINHSESLAVLHWFDRGKELSASGLLSFLRFFLICVSLHFFYMIRTKFDLVRENKILILVKLLHIFFCNLLQHLLLDFNPCFRICFSCIWKNMLLILAQFVHFCCNLLQHCVF